MNLLLDLTTVTSKWRCHTAWSRRCPRSCRSSSYVRVYFQVALSCWLMSRVSQVISNLLLDEESGSVRCYFQVALSSCMVSALSQVISFLLRCELPLLPGGAVVLTHVAGVPGHLVPPSLRTAVTSRSRCRIASSPGCPRSSPFSLRNTDVQFACGLAGCSAVRHPDDHLNRRERLRLPRMCCWLDQFACVPGHRAPPFLNDR